MKILIIGGGNMGMTYTHSFIRAKIVRADQMMVLSRNAEKSAILAAQHEGLYLNEPEDCVPYADLIILAVKPQDSTALFERIKPLIVEGQVFISIMAGIKIASIRHALGAEKIIRAMPNLPAQIGAGVTVFTSTEQVTRIELITVQNLLSTTGKTLYMEDEKMIDAATAISGSGPAYVYFFMQAMMEAAIEMGFSAAEAELLVGQTYTGAVDLYNKSDLSCHEWIQRVASKGGTTEAALSVFSSKAVHKDIIAATQAALKRAQALGK